MPEKFEMDLGEFGNRLEFATPNDMRTWNQAEFQTWVPLWDAGKPQTEPILRVHREFVQELNAQIERWEQFLGKAPVQSTTLEAPQRDR